MKAGTAPAAMTTCVCSEVPDAISVKKPSVWRRDSLN